MRTPCQPLTPDAKRRLAEEIRAAKHGSGDWFLGLVALWLHFCHEAGVKPADARAQGSPAYRKIEGTWNPAASKLTGIPSGALTTAWSKTVATYSAKAHELALQERANETAQPVPLF
jgi:hypothetical protein